jgi:vesicle coat complex subunit
LERVESGRVRKAIKMILAIMLQNSQISRVFSKVIKMILAEIGGQGASGNRKKEWNGES